MPQLREYKAKRDFTHTPEPRGKVNRHPSHTYVIQKHAARRLHYDLRLELDGVLKSWAVPKGPSLDPNVKRLAVHVEDHPIEYGQFEGTIPAGHYGAGAVMLWDNGKWQPQDNNARAAYKKGHLTFQLQGKKLKGLWNLVRMHNDPKNWLLIKVNDKYSKMNFDITEKQKLSVKSHQPIEKIAKIAEKQWTNVKLPTQVSPQLATLVNAAPDTDEWLHEVKLDGYRIICFIHNNDIRLLTRNQNDWTDKFPTIVKALQKFNFQDIILDGELVAINKKNSYHFQLLQNSIDEGNDKQLVYYAFDILYYKGKSLMDTPLIERKSILYQLLKTRTSKKIRYNDHVIGNGPAIYQKACKMGLEGIVAKKIDCIYTQKRTRDWLKLKCQHEQEFVIGGYTAPRGNRNHFGSLLIGYYDKNKKLRYCGHVGTGFTEGSLQKIYSLLRKHRSDKSPFAPHKLLDKHAHWVNPVLVCEVEFAEWTQDKILRHPSFKGLRQDKPAKKVSIEKTHSLKKRVKPAGNTLSHPDKVLFTAPKTTKQDLADFYRSIHNLILPQIINRPLTFVRCPQGSGQHCFYQKHLNENNNPHLHKINIKETHATRTYTYIKDVEGLLALVQLNILEIHCWNCQIDNVACPDRMIFDLDPAPEVAWARVVKTAFLIRDRLKKLKLESFVKTTGGKGLHIVVPIKPEYTWETVRNFAETFVQLLVDEQPKELIGTMSKAKRKNKIFIDYFRNNRSATSIAPYSTRAKEKPTVATPLAWSELNTKIKPDQFTVKNFATRIKKDPWKKLSTLTQALSFMDKNHS